MTSEVVTEGDECAAADGQDFLIEVGIVAEGEFQDAIGHFDGDQRRARRFRPTTSRPAQKTTAAVGSGTGAAPFPEMILPFGVRGKASSNTKAAGTM